MAVDTKDNKLKTFGLDRMTEIDISKTKYRESYSYDLKEMFTNLIISKNFLLPSNMIFQKQKKRTGKYSI